MRLEPTEGTHNLLARSLGVRPAVLRGVNTLMEAFTQNGTLEASVREFARKAAAPLVGCEYCSSIGDATEPSTAREALAAEYARRMATDVLSVSDQFFLELQESFNSDEIVDLTAWISYIVIGGQLFGAALKLPEAEEADVRAFRAAVQEGRR